MLRQLLSRLQPVRTATTREEREAIYRFRYEVYVEEYGRQLGSPDHERRWVTDDEDEKDTSTLFYAGSVKQISGTVRLRHWRAGEVPRYDLEEMSMDRFPDLERRNTGEIGRLMVRPAKRGRLVIAALLRASYELLAGAKETDLVFCYCSPGLVRYYQQLAMRPFGGRPVFTPDGVMLPLVSVVSDYDYYRDVDSFFAPMVRRYFGPGKRQPLDLEPYRRMFGPEERGLEFEPPLVRREVENALADRPAGGKPTLFDVLSPAEIRRLVGRGLVVDIPADTLITRQGFRERELFIILRGRFQADDGSRQSPPMICGEVFGEIAFLLPEGRRTASVRALDDGRLLILRGRSVEKLADRDPDLGTRLRSYLEGVMAHHRDGAAAPVVDLPGGTG